MVINLTQPTAVKPPTLPAPAQKKLDKPRLRVLVRNIPPNMTQDEFIKSIHLPNYTYFKFCRGDATFGAQRVCRAYLRFNHPYEVILFNKKVDGMLLEDKQGIKKQLIVEFAPLQKLPPPPKRKDKLDGTIDNDPLFKQFRESLEKQQQQNESTESTGTGNTIERVLHHLEEREKVKQKYKTGEVLTPLMQSLLVSTSNTNKDVTHRLKSSRERPYGSGGERRSQSKTSSKGGGTSSDKGETTPVPKDITKSTKADKNENAAVPVVARKPKKERSVRDADRYYQSARSHLHAGTDSSYDPEHADSVSTTTAAVDKYYRFNGGKPPSISEKSREPTKKSILTADSSKAVPSPAMIKNSDLQSEVISTKKHDSSMQTGYYNDTSRRSAKDEPRRLDATAPANRIEKVSSSRPSSSNVGKTTRTVDNEPPKTVNTSREKNSRNADRFLPEQPQSLSSSNADGLKARPSLQVYRPPPVNTNTKTSTTEKKPIEPSTTKSSEESKELRLAKQFAAKARQLAPEAAGNSSGGENTGFSQQQKSRNDAGRSGGGGGGYRRSAYYSNDYYENEPPPQSDAGKKKPINISSSAVADMFPEDREETSSAWRSSAETNITETKPRKDRIFTSKTRRADY